MKAKKKDNSNGEEKSEIEMQTVISSSSFIKKNFKQRQCKCFIPKVVTNEQNKDCNEVCYCGRTKEWHIENNIEIINNEDSKTEWTIESCTKTMPTNAFGKIEMIGFARNSIMTKAKYLRLDALETNFELLENFMINYWKLPRPQLILSVSGGSRNMTALPDELMSAIKTGLYYITSNLETWVITNGIFNGVSRLIGDAAYDMPIRERTEEKNFILIGILPWGLVHNRDNLLNTMSSSDNGLEHYYCNVIGDPGADEILDPNHTHLLFVDDGRLHCYNSELEFRNEFENQILSSEHRGPADLPTLKVHLLIEGGQAALYSLKVALDSGYPIIVIQHSSRCADLLATANSKIKEVIPIEEIRPIVQKTLEDDFWQWDMSEEVKEMCIEVVSRAIEKVDEQVFIFDYTSDDDSRLDKFILSVIIQTAGNLSLAQQLKLTMSMNRCDMAVSDIFTWANRQKLSELDLHEFMTTALLNNQVDFVKLMLREGVILQQYLTPRRLYHLYREVVNPSFRWSQSEDERGFLAKRLEATRSVLFDICKKKQHKIGNLMTRVGLLIHKLLKEVIPPFYHEKDFEHSKCKDGHNYENNHENEEGQRLLQPNEDHQIHQVPLFDNLVKKQYNEIEIPATTTSPTSSSNYNQAVFVPKVMEIFPKDEEEDVEDELTEKIYYRKFPPVNRLGQRVFNELDLFIWCVLLNRVDMARLFMGIGIDQISCTIVGRTILNEFKKIAIDGGEGNLAEEYEAGALEFESMGEQLLSITDSCGKNRTQLLLCRSLPQWASNTCISLATSSNAKVFLSKTPCQTRLNRIWMGSIPSTVGVFRIIFYIFFAPFLIRGIFPPPSPTTTKSTKSANKEKERPKERIDLGENFRNFSYFDALSHFYKAPITKFFIYAITYIFFLIGLSKLVLVDLKPVDNISEITALEWLIWIWCFAYIVEEVVQILGEDDLTIASRFKHWMKYTWNKFDFVIFFLVILSLVLRLSLTEEVFDYARAAYASVCVLFFLRFMHLYFADRRIGPKVIMVYKMMNDLFFFMCIYVIFVFAYGILVQALLFPNQKLSWSLFSSVTYVPFWQTFGDLNMNYMEPNATCSEDPNCNTRKHSFVLSVMAIYMVAVNILLVNLLIAMFGNTFSDVQNFSNVIWAFHRVELILEFQNRSNVPPPLNVIPLFVRGFVNLFKTIIIKKKVRKIEKNTPFKFYLQSKTDKKISRFEQNCFQLYSSQNDQGDDGQTHVNEIANRLKKLMDDLEPLRNTTSSDITNVTTADVKKTHFDAEDPELVKLIKSRLLGSLGSDQRSRGTSRLNLNLS